MFYIHSYHVLHILGDPVLSQNNNNYKLLASGPFQMSFEAKKQQGPLNHILNNHVAHGNQIRSLTKKSFDTSMLLIVIVGTPKLKTNMYHTKSILWIYNISVLCNSLFDEHVKSIVLHKVMHNYPKINVKASLERIPSYTLWWLCHSTCKRQRKNDQYYFELLWNAKWVLQPVKPSLQIRT